MSDLVSKVLSTLESSSNLQKYRKKISNRKSHVFSGNLERFKASVLEGVRRQRAKGWSASADQDSELTVVISEYLAKLYSILSLESQSKIFSYEIVAGTSTNFTSIIRGDGDIESHIQLLRNKANIGKVSNSIKRIFRLSGRNISVDVGHMEGSTVAQQFATAMLSKFESTGRIPINTSAAEKLKVLIKYDPISAKLLNIYVEDQFGLVNQSSTMEAEVAALLKEALGNFIDKEMPNLIKPKLNSVINSFLNVAKTKKKTPKLAVAGKQKSSKSKTLNTKNGKLSGQTLESPNRVKLEQEDIVRKVQTPKNWNSLIRIINTKLPQKVITNMGAPGLVNRTGTFANSTKVIDIQTTKEGYPSIVFDYQRGPYDVFDKTKGKAPWNTPARDPRALVDRSVREIVREMAIGRFFTRRA
jgi:hypothetical protein